MGQTVVNIRFLIKLIVEDEKGCDLPESQVREQVDKLIFLISVVQQSCVQKDIVGCQRVGFIPYGIEIQLFSPDLIVYDTVSQVG